MTRKEIESAEQRMRRLVAAALANEDPRGDDGNLGGVDPQRKIAANFARRWMDIELAKQRNPRNRVVVETLDQEFAEFCKDAGPAADSDEMRRWRRLELAEIRAAGSPTTPVRRQESGRRNTGAAQPPLVPRNEVRPC